MQRIGPQIMEMLCNWNSFVTFHAGEVQATCAISSIANLQNLLCIMLHLVLRVFFNLKTKLTPPTCLESRQPKNQMRTLTLSLYHHRPHHQLCPTLLATTLLKTRSSCFGCSEAEALAGNQSWEREEETASNRSSPAYQASSSLKNC